MSQFWEKSVTNARTNERTNPQRWIHRTFPAKGGGPIWGVEWWTFLSNCWKVFFLKKTQNKNFFIYETCLGQNLWHHGDKWENWRWCTMILSASSKEFHSSWCFSSLPLISKSGTLSNVVTTNLFGLPSRTSFSINPSLIILISCFLFEVEDNISLCEGRRVVKMSLRSFKIDFVSPDVCYSLCYNQSSDQRLTIHPIL